MQKLAFYRAQILNPISDLKCEYFPDALLVLERQGKNSVVKDLLSFEKGKKKYQRLMNSKNTHQFSHSLIMPTFFDMHFHWVQDDVREMPKDSLLSWLENYTFPAEKKFADAEYAQKKAEFFFKRLTQVGTLGGACYSSIHEVALIQAMKKVRGDFVIGNVLMNMNSPQDLSQTNQDSLKLVKKFINKYKKRYALTPRFAITTDPQVMSEGAKLTDKAGCFKQTHLSETPQEIEFVLSLYRKMPGFEKVNSYTEIYQKTKMLGKRSLMGHGIHLSAKELKILSETKTSLIHCPTSNAPIEQKGLGSGLFDFRKVEKAKIRWALGSDIGGGPILSMFDVMRSFVDQNQQIQNKRATYVKGLFRSTLAAAQILGIKNAGNFKKNNQANFIVVPLKAKYKNAEDVLKNLIEPLSRKREAYDQLPKMVIYQGKVLYQNSREIGQ